MGRGVEESRASHVEGVLQAGASLWFLISEGLKFANVIVWVARHITNSDGETITHADDTELGDGILLEKLGDKFLAEAQSKEVACWAEIFFRHGGGEVDDEDQMANNASLEGSGIFEESGTFEIQ